MTDSKRLYLYALAWLLALILSLFAFSRRGTCYPLYQGGRFLVFINYMYLHMIESCVCVCVCVCVCIGGGGWGVVVQLKGGW